MTTQKRGGPKAKKLAKAITEKMGIANPDVWYEPISGPCIEMQGYEGGWYYRDMDEPEWCGDTLGYSFDDAMKMIELNRRLMHPELD